MKKILAVMALTAIFALMPLMAASAREPAHTFPNNFGSIEEWHAWRADNNWRGGDFCRDAEGNWAGGLCWDAEGNWAGGLCWDADGNWIGCGNRWNVDRHRICGRVGRGRMRN